MIATLATIALAVLLGRTITSRLGEAFLLGAGMLWAITLLLDATHIGWSRPALLVAIAIIGVAAADLGRRRASENPAAEGGRRYTVSPIDLLTLILLAGYTLFAATAAPWEFDYLVDFGLKARTFVEHGGIDWNFLRNPPLERAFHPGYPLLLPLFYVDVASLAGAWTDRWLGLVHVAFSAALVLVIRAEWRCNRHVAAAATFLIAPLALSPWMGLGDGPLTSYLTAALLAIRRGSYTLGAILLGLAGCVKNEGLSLILAAAMAMLVAGQRRQLVRLWPALAIALPWVAVRTLLHIGTDITSGNPIERVTAHLADPSLFLASLAANPVGKVWLWIGIAVALLLRREHVLQRERFVLTAVILQVFFYLGAYFMTPHDVAWHVQWSWPRLVSHVAPVLAFIAVAALIEFIPREDAGSPVGPRAVTEDTVSAVLPEIPRLRAG